MSVTPHLSERPGAAAIGLHTLARHVNAYVAGLRPARDAHEQQLVLRLMEIGFLPGEPVRIIAAGIGGAGPLAVRVGQASFALRRAEAAQVLVVPQERAA